MVFLISVVAVYHSQNSQATSQIQEIIRRCFNGKLTITVEVAGSDPLFEGWHELVYVKDQIYTMKPDGKEVRRLTTTAFNDHAASWSPDNERIAFSSDRDGNTEVYVMEAGGKNVRRLTRTRATERAAFWSPDGKRLAFSSDGDGPSEVYVMNADGSSLRCLTRTSE